jgi:hypothetical protein
LVALPYACAQLLTAGLHAQELHAELVWSDEAATLAAERGSWFMVRTSFCSGCARPALGFAASAPSGVFLSSSDRTPLLRPAAARRPKQLLPEDVCACTSLEQAINGDHISLFNPAQLTARASRTEPLSSSAQVRAADEDPMQPSEDGGAHDVPAPIGHVSVCGVELRLSACAPERSHQPPVLVKTATVEQNLKSLALALCGVRLRLRPTARALGRLRHGAPGFETHILERFTASRYHQDIRMRAPAVAAVPASAAACADTLHALCRRVQCCWRGRAAPARASFCNTLHPAQARSPSPLPLFATLAAMHVRITAHTLR